MKFTKKNKNLVIAVFIALFTFALLLLSVKDIGMTWDEPAYMRASESYSNWVYIFVKDPIRALNSEVIDTFFKANHEHPPIAKMWSGVAWYFTKNLTDQLSAFRIGPMISVSILIACLFYMIAERFGKPAGFFAAASLITMPRFFFHAHLSALDVPVAVASFLTVFVFWKTIDRKGWGWGLLCGFFWGLAVGVKLNAVFVFFALLIWVLLFRRNRAAFLRLVVTGVSAILTFFIAWPWLYHDTWNRVVEYVKFHVNHYSIGQWYLGKFYLPPPWHAVFVILWAVVPLITILLFGVGIFQAKKGKNDGGTVWFLIINTLISIFPFAIGKSLLYDNERLFMPVFPFIAALAGVGFGWITNKINNLFDKSKITILKSLSMVVLGILLILPQGSSLVKYYPHLLSYYSEGVGGLKGATKIGLETTYWCETYRETINYINTHGNDHDIIWAECDTINTYKQFGILRSNVFCVNDFSEDANWYLLQYRQSQYGSGGAENYPPLKYLQSLTPDYEIEIDDIPLLNLYYSEK